MTATSPLHVWTGEPTVIDSSVAFKWLDPSESGAGLAVEMLRQHQRDEIALVVPAHLPLEVLNVLVSRRAEQDEVQDAVGFLADAELLIAPLDDTLLAEAARIAFEDRLALYDAAFIALAVLLEAPLVTADRRQASTTACGVRLIG